MQRYTRLYIDKVTSDFDPNKDLVLGPWCFRDSFSLNKIEEFFTKGVFLEKESIDDTKAFKCCEDQHSRLIEEVASYVKSINKDKYSLDFYKDYVGYWLINFIHLIHYSERLINEYIKKFNDAELELILSYKPTKVIFKDINDFKIKIANLIFLENFFLFLLIKNKPKKWKISYYNIDREIDAEREDQGKLSIYFSKFIYFLNRYLAPRVRIVYGLNIFEKILTSLVLLFKKPIKEKTFHKNYYSNIDEVYVEPPVSDINVIKLAKQLLPNSFKKIYKMKEKFSNCNGKIMLCSAASLLANDDEKFDLLLFKEKKGKIFSVQHGAHYGDLFLQRTSTEYGFDKFISWGQKKHQNYDINFQPLPSPQLQLNFKKNSSQNILFVSTANFYCLPRYVGLGSKNYFEESVYRINDTISFLNELDALFIEKIKYKDFSAGQFSEKSILKEKFKSLKFINTIPEQNLNKSKLIVQNHYSTFFYKSLAANAPTICFCKKDYWKLTTKAAKLYDNLHNAGILFYDSKLAAQKLKEVWPDITSWWANDKIQNARREFCDEYANRDDNWFSIWIKYLRQIK